MRARLVLVPVALAAALLAGCTTSTPQTTPTTAPADNGVSALPAAEILNRATTALINAKSFHVKGEVISGGETVKADVQLSGDNGKGTLVSAGQTIEIIRDGEDGYLKVPADFLALLIPPGTPNAPSADQLAALLKDKYIKIPVRNAIFAALASAIDPNELLKATGTLSVGGQDRQRGAHDRHRRRRRHGVPARELTSVRSTAAGVDLGLGRSRTCSRGLISNHGNKS